MKKINLSETRKFNPIAMNSSLLHDSPYFKIINFNLSAGQIFPVHSHEIEGQLSILVIEGDGKFLGRDSEITARTGDMLISDISEPHGVMAVSDMRIIVTIAPPI